MSGELEAPLPAPRTPSRPFDPEEVAALAAYSRGVTRCPRSALGLPHKHLFTKSDSDSKPKAPVKSLPATPPEAPKGPHRVPVLRPKIGDRLTGGQRSQNMDGELVIQLPPGTSITSSGHIRPDHARAAEQKERA